MTNPGIYFTHGFSCSAAQTAWILWGGKDAYRGAQERRNTGDRAVLYLSLDASLSQCSWRLLQSLSVVVVAFHAVSDADLRALLKELVLAAVSVVAVLSGSGALIAFFKMGGGA